MPTVSSTGVPNLDQILGGGLPARAMTAILGVPGSGKTILAEQIAVHHAKQEERVLIFTALSESHERMLADLAELSFADSALLGGNLRFYSVQAVLDDGPDAVVELIIDTVCDEHASLVVLDGLHGLVGHAERDQGVTRFLHTLRSRLALLDVTTLVTYETGPGQPAASGMLTIPDGIINLHNRLTDERHHRWIEVAKLRGMAHMDGLHTLTITGDGITCYPRQEAAYRPAPYEVTAGRAAIGLPELDEMIDGGLNVGTVTFLAGSPGTGKTLTALHFLMAGVAAGEPGLFVGLAEGAGQLYAKADTFGLDLRGAVARGDLSLHIVPPADVEVDILAAELRERVEALGIRRLAIDPFAVVEEAIPFPKRAPRYVASLLDYLRERGVTTILTQVSDALYGGRFANTQGAVLADNLMELRWVEYQSRLYRILSVRQMRSSAFDPGLREFRIEAGAIRVLPLAESGIATMGGIEAQEHRETRLTRRNQPE
ncbi:MAG: KaiA-binding protein [Thermomicrobia bacterium]|nr:KaiA-binding protein [Thermomicrobia bacterium]